MSLRKCCVECCSSENKPVVDQVFSFHKFPTKSPLKYEWKTATRVVADVDKSMFVCSKHFTDDDFQKVRGTKMYLKSGAVPSVFAWNDIVKSKNDNVQEEAISSSSNIAIGEYYSTPSSKICGQDANENEHDESPKESNDEIPEASNSSVADEMSTNAQPLENTTNNKNSDTCADTSVIDENEESSNAERSKCDIDAGKITNDTLKTSYTKCDLHQSKNIVTPDTESTKEVSGICDDNQMTEERLPLSAIENTKENIPGTSVSSIGVDECEDNNQLSNEQVGNAINDHYLDETSQLGNLNNETLSSQQNNTCSSKDEEELDYPINANDADKSHIHNDTQDTDESKNDDFVLSIIEDSKNTTDSFETDSSTINDSQDGTKLVNDSQCEYKMKSDIAESQNIGYGQTTESSKTSVEITNDMEEPMKTDDNSLIPNVHKEENISEPSNVDDKLQSKSNFIDNTELHKIETLGVCDSPMTDSMNDLKSSLKYSSVIEKGSTQSQALNVGSRVEVCDYGNIWYGAVILEVDYEEMEVLLQYDNSEQKQNEWISVYSTRLRSGLSEGEMLLNTVKHPDPSLILSPPRRKPRTKKTPQTTITKKISRKRGFVHTFSPGERCLARWTYNRRFQATVRKVLDDGSYEVVFDDGFVKISKGSALCKLQRAASGNGTPTTPHPAATTPERSGNFSTSTAYETAYPDTPVMVHRHLFDPNLDYLGSKKERREMKRKLNIKDLFSFKKLKKMEEKQDSQQKTFKFNKRVKMKENIDSHHIKRPKSIKRPLPIESEDLQLHPKKRGRKQRAKTLLDTSLSYLTTNKVITETPPVVEMKQGVIEEATLPPGQWCCRWLNGQPVGLVSELEISPTGSDTTAGASTTRLARRSVMVDDYRLPPNWTKHMIRRSVGSSAGKWDVLLLSPEGIRFRIRSEMRAYLDEPGRLDELKAYEDCLLDFGIHRKRSRQMGWDVTDPSLVGMEGQPTPLPAGHSLLFTSPLIKQTKKRDKESFMKKRDKESYTKKRDKESYTKKRDKELGTKKRDKESYTKKKDKESMPNPRRILKEQVFKREKKKKLKENITNGSPVVISEPEPQWFAPSTFERRESVDKNFHLEPLEDGYVYVGSLKVQVVDNQLRCPKEGCLKNFRKDNLLQMHIKHYHRELKSQLGITPNVADLAYARTLVPEEEPSTPKLPKQTKDIKTKTKRSTEAKLDNSLNAIFQETWNEFSASGKPDIQVQYRSPNDSPKLRSVLERDGSSVKKHHKRHSKHEADNAEKENKTHHKFQSQISMYCETDVSSPRSAGGAADKELHFVGAKAEHDSSKSQSPGLHREIADFDDLEVSIKTNTLSKSAIKHKKTGKGEKKKTPGNLTFKGVPTKKKRASSGGTARKSGSIGMWGAYDPDETRSSFGTPEQVATPITAGVDVKSEESNQPSSKFITEGGQTIKIVHMKREEIINCACKYNEEDGLMVQCELCLCWQHALCHSIETESQVPEKYICFICLNPRRGRRSQRFLYDQTWLYEGVLPSWKGVSSGANAAEASQRAAALKKSFDLSGNLYLIAQALHAVKIKMHVAKKKDHPKLYLWSKPWDPPASKSQANVVVEQLSDLNVMPKIDMNSMMADQIGKENCPVALKVEDIKSVMKIDPPDINQMKNPMSSDDGGDILPIAVSSDELSKIPDGQLNVQSSGSNLLANFLASPGGTSIDLPISTSELETLAKSVQDCGSSVCESTVPVPSAPEPEAAIDPVKCRELLHQHVNKALAAFEVRLDSIEAQIAELESQDPCLEDDESAEYCPRTKQTIQMLLRDLETMEELAYVV